MDITIANTIANCQTISRLFLPSLSNLVAFFVRALLAAIAFAPSKSGMLNNSEAQMVCLSRRLDIAIANSIANCQTFFCVFLPTLCNLVIYSVFSPPSQIELEAAFTFESSSDSLKHSFLAKELGVIMVNVFVLGLMRMLFVYIRLHLLSLLHKIISGL